MSVKISELPAAASSLSTDQFEVNQGGVSKSVTTAQIGTEAVADKKIITNPSATSTDNALARFDLTTGLLVQNSAATVSDAGLLTTASAKLTGLTTGVVHADADGDLTSSLIVNADIDAAAGIVDTKLATISTAGKVSNSATTATSANTASTIVVRDVSGNFVAGTITASLTGHASLDLPLSGGTLSGTLVLAGDGVGSLDAVTVQQLASVAGGFSVKSATRVGTTGALTVTYSNGAAGVGATLTNAGTQVAISIDGVSLSVNDRVLVKDQASSLQNGIYQVTTVGSGATNWVLTRTTDYDTPGEMPPGSLIPISAGTANANSSWFQSVTVTTIGTDPITYTQFTANPADFLKKANNLSDLTSASTAVTNLGLNAGTQALSVAALTATSIKDTTLTTGVVHSDSDGDFTSSLITNADIENLAGIVDSKLATISTIGKVDNSATTATSTNTPSTIVARDGFGATNVGALTATALTDTGLSTGVVHSDVGGVLSSSLIVNADVSASAAIVDTKLATISTASKVSNSATTATSANTASAIVARDGSGNFSAGTITATVTGASSLNVLKAGDTMTGALAINPTTNQLVLGGVSAGTTTTITSTAPASNKTYTIPDAGANTQFVMGAGNQTIAGTKTFSGTILVDTIDTTLGATTLVIGNTNSNGVTLGKASSPVTVVDVLKVSATSNQILLNGNANTTTITAGNHAASRTYTIPDAGGAASFVMTAGNQTIAGTKTFSSGIPITAVTNQLVLGTTNTTTISSTAPASSRTYTLADAGANVSFTMRSSALGSTQVPYADTNGNLTSSSNMTYTAASSTLSTGLTGKVISAKLDSPNNETPLIFNFDQQTGNVFYSNVQIITSGNVNQLAFSNINPTIINVVTGNNRTYTVPEVGTNTDFAMCAGTQTIAGTKTFSGTTNLSGLTASQAVVTDGSKNLASLQYTNANTASTIVSRDGSGNFTAGTITAALTGAASSNVLKAGDTMTGALTINPTTNQLVLGGVSAGTTTTISSTAPAANRTYTIPDFGGSGGNFVLTSNTTKTISTGTWVPTMGDLTNNFTLSTGLGWYSRIGDTVYYSTNIAWSSKGSATGSLFISLPFATTSSTGYRGNGVVSYTSGVVWTQASKDTFLAFALNDNSSQGQLISCASDGTAGAAVTGAACSASGAIQVSGFFRTA